MDEPATQDIRSFALWPILKQALGTPTDPQLQDAIALLQGWYDRSGHRRDLDRDGDVRGRRSGDADGRLVAAARRCRVPSALGDRGLQCPTRDARLRRGGPGGTPAAPAFSDGWWGFVSKDLRDVFTPTSVVGPWSRKYCGNGSQDACRSALQTSLKEALSVTRQELYGAGDCQDDPQASCFDMNRFTVASAIGVPPFPFQNRPTFQQTVELTRTLPR